LRIFVKRECFYCTATYHLRREVLFVHATFAHLSNSRTHLHPIDQRAPRFASWEVFHRGYASGTLQQMVHLQQAQDYAWSSSRYLPGVTTCYNQRQQPFLFRPSSSSRIEGNRRPLQRERVRRVMCKHRPAAESHLPCQSWSSVTGCRNDTEARLCATSQDRERRAENIALRRTCRWT